MDLAEGLSELAERYAYERAKPFANNNFGNRMRNDLAQAAKRLLPFGFTDLTVKSSVGAGNWASVPWLAFFDPLITTTAQEGFYVVFLINPDSKRIYLSLNQGTTAVYKEFRQVRGRDVLRRRALDMRERVLDISRRFKETNIELGSLDDLPLGYEAGHCLGLSYSSAEILTIDLAADLEEILRVYRRLVSRGGTTPSDMMLEQAETQDIIEARRYVLSRRIERSTKVRMGVLSKRAAVCEGCGLDPHIDYSFNGRPENVPLDVHHIAPLSGLEEGETKQYRIPDDFFVLCPTCHRMIHKQDDPSDLTELKASIRFKHMRLV